LGHRATVTSLLTLTVVTGLVDAVSYLRLGRVFVANMTGNVVFLGFSLQSHTGLSPIASVIAIGGFLVGALGGGRAAHHFDQRPRQWLTGAFALEAATLGLVAGLLESGLLSMSGGRSYVAVAVLAVALGVQNSTVRALALPDLTTTVLTLTLTGLAADSTLASGPGSRQGRRIGSVAAMLAGAAAGAALLQDSPSAVILLAAVLVAVVAAGFGTLPAGAASAGATAPAVQPG
jgi:uncharacterized membrane protein YoaK (UPF0700 family)